MKEDDEMLARIGKHVRDEQKDDARFERVARGEASSEEVAELEKAAKDDSSLAVRLEASRPFDEIAVARIAKNVGPKRPADVKPAATKKSNVARRIATITGPLALAAAIFLYFSNAQEKGPVLPGYEISATSEQAMRGPAGPDTRIRVGSARDARFEIVARPASATPTKVVAYAFVMLEGSKAEPLEAKIDVSPDGAIKVAGEARALEGAREVRIVIGPPASIGKFEDAATLAQKNEKSTRVRVLSVAIDR